MSPTRPTMLAALALLSGVLGLALADLVLTVWGRMMPVPWSSAVTVCAVAAVLIGWTVSFRRKLRDETRRVDPFVAVRTAALAMAASRAGSIIAGLFVGVGLWFASDLSVPVAQERLVVCVVGAVGAVVLVLTALWLERSCRLPDDPDAPPGESARSDERGDWVHPHTSSR